MPIFNLSQLPQNSTLIDLLEKSHLVSSRGEAKRLIDQDAVTVNQVKVTTPDTKFKPGDIIRAGKRRFIKLT